MNSVRLLAAIALVLPASFAGANEAALPNSTASVPAASAASVVPPLPRCEQALASVMVGKLQCKASNCGGAPANAPNTGLAALLQLANVANGGPANVTGIADGIKDVLVTALADTGCFDIQDREQMDEIARELDLAGKKVQTQQADFLISGAVTQVDVSVENTSFGGGLLPVIGSIGTKTQKAAVSLDMRLVDVNTAKVLGSKRATASTENSSLSLGGFGGGAVGGTFAGFGGQFQSLQGTNLEAVTKDAIAQSVVFLVEQVKTAKASRTALATPR
ncbi:MAG TPA: CsgG/HfaB family protein [Rubrivivax sp.]|nr:CsgG/HfaB family protein [Rubrivivax sp.]